MLVAITMSDVPEGKRVVPVHPYYWPSICIQAGVPDSYDGVIMREGDHGDLSRSYVVLAKEDIVPAPLDCGSLTDAERNNVRVLYAINEATPNDEAEEDRIIEEAQAKAARNAQSQRQLFGVVDLTLTDGVWKE